MLGGDPEIIPLAETRALAEQLARDQADLIRGAIAAVSARLPRPVRSVIAAGSGEFLISNLIENNVDIVSLGGMLGTSISTAACAYAVAILAAERGLHE
jgi:uncharacterized hydantoinase/oxoprolinase family protein